MGEDRVVLLGTYIYHVDSASCTFNELCSFGPGTANIIRKMVGLPEAAWTKEEEKNKKEEDDKSHFHNNSAV